MTNIKFLELIPVFQPPCDFVLQINTCTVHYVQGWKFSSFSLISSFFMSRKPVFNYRGPLFRDLNLSFSSFFEIGHFHPCKQFTPHTNTGVGCIYCAMPTCAPPVPTCRYRWHFLQCVHVLHPPWRLAQAPLPSSVIALLTGGAVPCLPTRVQAHSHTQEAYLNSAPTWESSL